MNYLTGSFFGISNKAAFGKGIQQAISSLDSQSGIYATDNLFTFNRNLSFLGEEAFRASLQRNVDPKIEAQTPWRQAVVAWGARHGLRLGRGDLVECGCYRGTTARIVCEYVGLKDHVDRRYFLYDLFVHDSTMSHERMSEHGEHLHDFVRKRFSDLPNVFVTQGRVPEVLGEVAPESIAFMNLDLNSAEAEIGALEVLFERMIPGSVLILDDYGWDGYLAQKIAEDAWFESRGYRVLELPTGQGLVIR